MILGSAATLFLSKALHPFKTTLEMFEVGLECAAQIGILIAVVALDQRAHILGGGSRTIHLVGCGVLRAAALLLHRPFVITKKFIEVLIVFLRQALHLRPDIMIAANQ